MSTRSLTILNLYPRQMNIYGDVGNLLVLKKRCEWRDISVRVVDFNPADNIAKLEGIDLILGGGGQDSGQAAVQPHLLRIGSGLSELIEAGVPALVVCGTFQLFGNYIKTTAGEELEGIGVFDMHTQGDNERKIGNIVTKSSDFGELIGYENHSGKTYLGTGLKPFAKVVSGGGNNGEDGTEGARYHRAIGTYLHGPLLPKNPLVADSLIAAALERRYGNVGELAPLPDTWVMQAREVAKHRPR